MEAVNDLDLARQQSREDLRRILENLPVAVVTHTLESPFHTLYVNRQFVETFGYTMQEVPTVSEWAASAYPDPDYRRKVFREWDAAVARAIRVKGTIESMEFEVAAKDLTRRNVVFHAVVMEDRLLITLTDITARKKAEDELAAARRREKEIEQEMRETLEKKLKTSLHAAAVAHEINQPLSRILLRSEMELERATGRERETLEALVDDARRVVATIEKMRILLRSVETSHPLINLREVTESARFQAKTLLRQSNVELHLRLPGEPALLPGDEVQLQTALTNLLKNAAQAITAAGSTRREIEVEARAHPDHVELIVGDSGPGWPGGSIDEMLLRTNKPDGTGIGLYIVKTVVENHHGAIAIGKSPLGGAEFRISLPTLG